MANRSSNKAAVPEAKGALDKFKYEVASELGVPLSDGYNGDLTSRQNRWQANSLTPPAKARNADWKIAKNQHMISIITKLSCVDYFLLYLQSLHIAASLLYPPDPSAVISPVMLYHNSCRILIIRQFSDPFFIFFRKLICGLICHLKDLRILIDISKLEIHKSALADAKKVSGTT